MRLIFSLSSESGFDNLEKTQETRGGFYICQKDFLSIIKEEIESITKKIKPNPSENKNVLLKVLKKKHPKLFTKNIFPLNYDVISLILISGIFTLKNLLSVKDNSKDKNLKSPFFNENEILYRILSIKEKPLISSPKSKDHKFKKKTKWDISHNINHILSHVFKDSDLTNFEDDLLKLTDIFHNLPIFSVFKTLIQKIKDLKLINKLGRIFILFELIDFEKTSVPDIIEFFEILIPQSLKKKYGQVYTPYNIAKFMTKLCIQSPNQRVMDPASGMGILLQAVAQRKLGLFTLEDTRSSKFDSILNYSLKLYGVELNFITASISVILFLKAFQQFEALNWSFFPLKEKIKNDNLKKTIKYPDVNVYLGNLFEITPPRSLPCISGYLNKNNNKFSQDRIHSKSKSSIFSFEKRFKKLRKKFDVIIANPPYIKQEKIPDKDNLLSGLPQQARQWLDGVGVMEWKDYSGIKLPLSAKTDYYGFFLWYCSFLLKTKGIICFLIPNKWLDVKYGTKLKKFLLDTFEILVMIEFDSNIFSSAQVSNLILLARKQPISEKRNNRIVRFVKVNNKSSYTDDIQGIKNLIFKKLNEKIRKKCKDNQEKGYFTQTKEYNCTFCLQKFLDEREKWSFRYTFQSRFLRQIEKRALILMDNKEVCSVVSGIKTGANAFFFPSKKNRNKFGIEARFLCPGIKSGRDIPKTFIIEENACPHKFLSVPPNLKVEKYEGLSKFIDFGKNEKNYPQRPSMNWNPWFSIPKEKQDSPDLLFLRHINKELYVRWNQTGAIVADGIRGLEIFNKSHIDFYLGVLNSTFFYWQAHIRGRWEGQGALQLLVYELRKFLIPDVSKVSNQKRKKVEKLVKKIIYEKKDSLDIDPNLQKDLDIAVLDCMDLKDKYTVLYEETRYLEEKRIGKKL